jgi:hypothetical protein
MLQMDDNKFNNKNDIKMREVWVKSGQRLLPSTGKVCGVGYGQKILSFVG